VQCCLSLAAHVARVSTLWLLCWQMLPFFSLGETEHEDLSFKVCVSDAHFPLPSHSHADQLNPV